MMLADSLLGRSAQMLLDVLYPPQCLLCPARVQDDGALCPHCWRETPFLHGLACDLCAQPLPGEDPGWPVHCDACLALGGRDWQQGRAALLYRGNARKLVLRLKHGDRTQLAKPAARWMAQAGRGMLTEGRVLVPVPLHWSRVLSRRYSQSALLAQALARETGLPLRLRALIRPRRTKMLDGASRAERAAILSGAISPHPRLGEQLAGREVILVDDVMTSGATLSAAAQAARAAGAASVRILVLARVAKDG